MSKKNNSATLEAISTSPNGSGPQFGEVQFIDDPTQYKIKHPSDKALYNLVNKKLIQPIPKPRDANNMVLTLQSVWGDKGEAVLQNIKDAGQIIFHSVGDTGAVSGPKNIDAVTDKMGNDFINEPDGQKPVFLFHVGDVVYSFGEAEYYYDQFYDPFRNYPAPIVAIPGNHDGLVYTGDPTPTLDAFLRNFVNTDAIQTPEAGGLIRTAMTQPGVYFAFDAYYVTIIGLYSNALEDPGIISSQGDNTSPVTDEQLTFLTDQLNRVKDSGRAVIIALHHPPFVFGGEHSGSPIMSADLDKVFIAAGFWPHAILSGHAHNYQRFTRNPKNSGYNIPYIICGNGGHNVIALKSSASTALRAPQPVTDELVFENYDDRNYGYLRIICDTKKLTIEYHDAEPDQKTYSDAVTIDLQSHTKIAN